MDEDEVVDYLVLEAVAAKVANEDEKNAKKKEIQDWKKKTDPNLMGLPALR